jgi:biopolymer transport protein ExbB
MKNGFMLRIIFLLLLAAGVFFLVMGFGDKVVSTGDKTFFQQFVVAGGPIVWFVLLPLSIAAVFLTIEFTLTIRPARLLAGPDLDDIKDAIAEGGLASLKSLLKDRQDMASVALFRAFSQGGADDWFRIKNAAADSLGDQAADLYRKISWINLAATISPMVGLFGTVFGMIKLFNAIVVSGGQPQPVQLAEGISLALVTTFWGLLIAIPSVAVHGIFRSRIESLAGKAVVENEQLLCLIRNAMTSRKKNHTQSLHSSKSREVI